METFILNPRETGLETLDFSALFGNKNPVVLEIGSGKGRFLISSAQERPGFNFVGVEKSLHYHRVIEERVRKRRISNVRLINYDGAMVLEKMVPSDSLDEVHIYFPDPWPRPREQKRRIIGPAVLRQLLRVLKPHGTGIFVTDHQEYFEKAAPMIEEFFESHCSQPEAEAAPRTNYEAKYRQEGRPIYEVRFRMRRV